MVKNWSDTWPCLLVLGGLALLVACMVSICSFLEQL